MGLSDSIYLIGMPGSGKSTLGRQLAQRLGLEFIDLDEEIEQHEGQSIPEIFSSRGEAHFRAVENKLLINISQNSETVVMATGGGTPCHYHGIDFMLDNGRVVFLNISIPELMKRLDKTDIATRPKFGSKEDLKNQLQLLLTERMPVYQKAHIVIDDDSITAETIAHRLNR
ncbi:MAG: shikimate kinase [Fulvivirga sp.]|nr:shikimate kinase [Fulvivirga sp.]